MSAVTMQAAPREGLLRSVPFHLERADGDDDQGDGRTLEGYGAVFDTPTAIDSWEGTFTEKIRRGAFRKTIRENTPVLQFDHGRHPLIGSIPIGAIEQLNEDDQGLFVRARLSDNWLIEPVRQAIAERSIKGMSFRFTVIREEWRDNEGKLVKPDELGRLLWDPGDRGPLERTLIELRMPELGPVVFPAYPETTVDVRARSVAELIGQDRALTREVRASLAREAIPRPRPGMEDLGDPDVRRDVARALLFGATDPDTPDGESDPTPAATPPHGEHLAARTTATPGAPLTEEHPPTVSDAPLAPEHPSPSALTSRLKSEIREITDLMGEELERISSKDD
ncbi:HK97 family phage prohead protease [Streptomyces sp. NPDC045251]|uniref:HK97 family phage prohead protease n=1 Tax=unclassified Streptomyces TaxID=2593676 RepID=UPI0033D22C8E